ncbi:hypothetical protein K435DRAFT_35333 [Dendrothele bispora CBS 962.96]|uniref:Uncharacterized protein n=1 Tax=Dendrothele bispora (strain CBS 962.96) TaxID=1314807 RepID=A0A4S8M809_DENBC|nr:hypothetical protein K435DRAFT_35333 [Dendrothele bispora CBS 962.96]
MIYPRLPKIVPKFRLVFFLFRCTHFLFFFPLSSLFLSPLPLIRLSLFLLSSLSLSLSLSLSSHSRLQSEYISINRPVSNCYLFCCSFLFSQIAVLFLLFSYYKSLFLFFFCFLVFSLPLYLSLF